MKLLLALLFLFIIGYIIYLKWPTDNNEWLSIKLKQTQLNLTIKEYYKQSGKYLKISGKFDNNDTLFEYVLYSQPFNLGPLEKVSPMRKISSGTTSVKNEDYYMFVSSTDTLVTHLNSFPIELADKIILNSFDSLIRTKNSLNAMYHKSYQNILDFKKLAFSETDNGLFLETY